MSVAVFSLLGVVAGCALILLAWQNRRLRRALARQIERSEEAADRAWELNDTEERARSLREAQEARAAAEAASRAKSRFLATVSHEIRTPLNGILGMSDLLIDSGLTREQITYAQAVKTSGETLLSLINEILDFSKIEAGKLELSSRPFGLTALVEQLTELLAPRAQEKGLEIACSVDERLPERVIGDAARLRQVLLNLAGNAVKFTEKGGLAVIVEPGTQPDEVTFTVRDTGVGIPAEAQERIFGEFEQAEDGPARRFGGTGLGLAISQRIAERMGGRITVDSVPGTGSTFTFTVRLPRTTDSAAATFAAPQLDGLAVLIVASSPFEVPLAGARLARWGATIRTVNDADQARALLSEKAWDALLVDYALGSAAAESLARAASSVPRRIVLLTPEQRHALGSLLEVAFTGYLVKPIRAASLAARFGADAGAEPVLSIVSERDASAADSTPGLSILIAEDNDINALLTRSLVEKLGHRPTVVANGRLAVETWRNARAEKPFDLVLMDVQMPELDGLEATRRIRAIEAEDGGAPAPIIALTANAYSEDREACVAAGMNDIIMKPLDRLRLVEALALARASAPKPVAA